jgi:hypothetical protein
MILFIFFYIKKRESKSEVFEGFDVIKSRHIIRN